LNFREILLGFQDYGQAGVLSYGPCQFPTLGFIVDRYKQIKEFVPEKFWSIVLKYNKPLGKG
jgi:DNA topoisomerase-3